MDDGLTVDEVLKETYKNLKDSDLAGKEIDLERNNGEDYRNFPVAETIDKSDHFDVILGGDEYEEAVLMNSEDMKYAVSHGTPYPNYEHSRKFSGDLLCIEMPENIEDESQFLWEIIEDRDTKYFRKSLLYGRPEGLVILPNEGMKHKNIKEQVENEISQKEDDLGLEFATNKHDIRTSRGVNPHGVKMKAPALAPCKYTLNPATLTPEIKKYEDHSEKLPELLKNVVVNYLQNYNPKKTTREKIKQNLQN